MLGLGWNIRQLLVFEQALRDKEFGSLRYGDSIWSQHYSRFSYLRSQSKEYKKNYRRLVKEVRKSTNAMPDGGIILNNDFEIVLCNKAAKRLAGFRRHADKGHRVDNILRDPAFGAYLKSGDFDVGVEVRSPVTNGGWLLCRIVPYGADQLLLLIQDVTDRRALAKMRRDFVANASHELRSPLTVLSGYLDMLTEDEEVPEHWQKPLAQMQAQSRRMNNIVAELLELSRVESAGAAPGDNIVDICRLLSDAKSSLAGSDDIASVDIHCDPNIQLRGSAAEIESVIVNLLTNAIRHTPGDGSISISWSAQNGGASLEVSDTCTCIDPEHLPRLTERFFRVDAGRSRDGGGVGLGLAIVKHILNRHEANLDIESEPGAGSKFTCQFPRERTVAESTQTASR
jgi:two-component system phosphate regulon sensor histidine kinase PhoR